MSVLKVKKDSVWEEVGGISGHTHTTTDITNFPSSLPADGGNADTVDGKHASDFAAATDMTTAQSDISDLQTKVGDATVSAQISAAIEEKVSAAVGEAEQHARVAQECAQAMAGTFDFTGYLRYQIVDAAPETYDEGVLYIVTKS